MEQDFNENAPKSLESLRGTALVTCFSHFLIRNPSPKVYERFAKAVDGYLDAFREKYKSLQEYIDEQEKNLLPLLAQKGIRQESQIIEFDAAQKEKIAKLNDAVYDPGKYLNRDEFAQLFIIDLPAAYEKIVKHLNDRPDAPLPPETVVKNTPTLKK